MNQLFEFIAHHPLLVAILVIILVFIFLEESKRNIKGIRNLTPQEAIRYINDSGAIVVDLRNSVEFQAGHILSAININNEDLKKNINKLTKYKNKPIILVCATGQISPGIASFLRKQGFSQPSVLTGGILAWKKADLPLVKS